MGEFSWIYSDTERHVINGKKADTYLLVPKEFQHKYGKAIYEGCYDGYGMFSGYDVYDLIPEWNKDMIPEIVRRMKKGTWHCTGNETDHENLMHYYNDEPISCELRWLGIMMACYDDDNSALEYPIKITTKEMEYEYVSPSESDPNQGWEQYDDDYDEDDDWYE